MSMLSVVGGSDFNVCIVKPEVALRSPETPQVKKIDSVVYIYLTDKNRIWSKTIIRPAD